MVTNRPLDGHPPSPGWSPTIPWMVTYHPQGSHPPSQEWSLTIPWMVTTVPRRVTDHLQDGEPEVDFDCSAAQLDEVVVVLGLRQGQL